MQSVDPNQTPRSDLGLHCLLISLLWDGRHKLVYFLHAVKMNTFIFFLFFSFFFFFFFFFFFLATSDWRVHVK